MSGDPQDAKDAHMANLFAWLCMRPCVEEAVDALEDYALRDLLGWLASNNVLTGIPGMIYGLALVAAAKRFETS